MSSYSSSDAHPGHETELDPVDQAPLNWFVIGFAGGLALVIGYLGYRAFDALQQAAPEAEPEHTPVTTA
jgi:hypothetical protein